MVDLHTHSNISDGELPPAMLIKQAVKQGLKAIALTDHDTLGGLEAAKNEALAANIRFIPGIEINIDWTGRNGVSGPGPGGEFHLLGLGLNKPTPAFLAAVQALSLRRVNRNRQILDKMYEFSMITDIDAAWAELEAIAGGQKGTSLGRLHFASLLIKRKIVKNVNQAFDRYLGAGKPLFAPKEGMKFDEAVALIRESGGIPVLAHPISLFVSWGKLPDLIKALKDQGLMGLEAWHPTAKPGSCRRLEILAKELGLYITEGSDYHGSVRPDRKLGYSAKGRKIDDAILEVIPELAV
ncbi:MAG: PHP domain-containing protein [Treponema sp.]|jgi:predicted metal-dependent phosphoesterase TrpH|nr:PHP domain-containing protein [Treponema sp.]